MPTTLAELQQRSDLWWLAAKGKELARSITRSATRREIANIPQRWRNLVFYREMTGRPSLAQFVYGMAKRPSNFVSYYKTFQFSGVKSGFAATMADVYVNRLLGHQTFISMVPVKGNAEQNAMAQEIEEGIELSDDQLCYQRERTTMATEAFWYGGGCMHFGEDGQGDPMLEAVNPDEMLYASYDDPNPYDVIRRVWAKKTELLESKGIKGNREAEQAVLNAQSAYPAFYFDRGEPDCVDVVPILEGYTRPLSKSAPGRHVKVIGDFVLLDTDWEYPHPFEWWNYNPLPGSIMGQGIAELLLQISQWIDGLLTTIQECEVRAGHPKWMVEENSNVNPDALGDLNAAIVTYLGAKPTLDAPEPIGRYALETLRFLMDLGRARVHVSEASVQGQMPAGITAAIAMEKYAQIDDTTFLEKIGRLEDFDKRAAYQKIMLFKRLNAKFKAGNRSFDWSKIPLNKSFRVDDLEAYNVGRIAQTVAGRVQIVEQMRANNRIDDRAYNKFLQTPDIPGMFRDLNAETNDIDKQLDNLVKGDDYVPPTPYMDFNYAKKAVEIRYAREEFDGLIEGKQTNQAALDRLAMWRATVMSFLKQQQTPDAPPSPVVAGAPAAPTDGFAAPPLPPIVPGAPPPPALPGTPAPGLPQINNSAVPA